MLGRNRHTLSSTESSPVGTRMSADEADRHGLKHGDLTEIILGVFFDVYRELGYGFVEAVYREAMSIALGEVGVPVETEYPLDAYFRGRRVGHFRADLLVGGRVLLELKATPRLEPAHAAQLLGYLRCSVIEVGLLLNFGPRPQTRRLIFSNNKKVSAHRWINSGSNRSHPRKSADSVSTGSHS